MKCFSYCIVILLCACSPALNTTAIDYRGNEILLGKCTRAKLETAPYNVWFTKNYNEYKLDTATVQQIKEALKTKQLFIFMGTWCGDSRREVPRLYKILDYCGVRAKLINLYNQGPHYKQSPTREEKGLDITHVPTLLIVEHNKEQGRIVETPVVSWEKDLLAILTGEPYQPHHIKGPYKTRPISIH